MSGCDDAVVEVGEVQLLVGRVGVFVGQADAEQHGRHLQLFLERRDDRDRTGNLLVAKGTLDLAENASKSKHNPILCFHC